ncbi:MULTISPECIES: hypothetical protein [unclassified Marinobacterium]|jgi:TolA-binding protein|uniref:hypothetical protein n=1 Tax=unclassified Marinobacterium TaxID=2644139 RepID=UPI001569B3CC|nr:MULTISPECIES: hypothetical protein [unclassified Marinobacterium]NRP46352.1 hypothetical protein [Marinobacterium sp. xm-d-543]NRQ22688.1 hypothetical protein [Marinobacterium sp. xm-m-312]
MSVENEYKEALKRLQKQGKRISNDSVAKEAGRKPTAITKRRFPELVALIAEAAEEQKSSSATSEAAKERRIKEDYRENLKQTQKQLADALGRISSLEYQLFEQQIEIMRLRGEKTISFPHLKEKKKQTMLNEE